MYKNAEKSQRSNNEVFFFLYGLIIICWCYTVLSFNMVVLPHGGRSCIK